MPKRVGSLKAAGRVTTKATVSFQVNRNGYYIGDRKGYYHPPNIFTHF